MNFKSKSIVNIRRQILNLLLLFGTQYCLSGNPIVLSENIFLSPPSTMNQRFSVPGYYTFTVPEGVTSITVQTWGGGGRGGSRTSSSNGTGGGGGGAFSASTLSVTPGETYVVYVGAGSTSNTVPGNDSYFALNDINDALVLAKGGNSAASNSTSGATGGDAASGIGTIRYSGGAGANRVSSTASGGGGSSAGSSADGNNASGTSGGIAPFEGGNGGNGRTSAGSGNPGYYPGGGGGGAVRSSSGSPSGGAGGHGQVNIIYSYNVNAGDDQTQCNNSLFYVSTTPPPSGFTTAWAVVSGTGQIYTSSGTRTSVVVPRGFSATVRLTVTDGVITVTDDVLLTNTNACTPTCTNPLNVNGDLENSGSITNYNLSFQGTPAALIYQNTNPNGWAEAYGSNSPNTSAFTGAYHLNKTGANGNPHGGSKFAYMAGNGFCFSALKTGATLDCGKTYKVSVWIAAYTNGSTQNNSPFFLEFFSGGDNVPIVSVAHECIAPKSTSWNNLNWQHYSFTYQVPSSGYTWSDFVFTSLHATNGIVIDDMCIEEVSSGSYANAGEDMMNCNNQFTMSANTPTSGYTGNWSVLSGNANISDVNAPDTDVTIASGNSARLRWTVTDSGGNNASTALDPDAEGGFETCCSPESNGWSTANHSTNGWNVGAVSNPSSGSQAAYISNNSGISYGYTNSTSQTSHLYRNITIPADATNITLKFKWKCYGQSGYDRILVYTADSGFTPSSGTPSSNSTSLSGADLVSGTNLHSSYNYQQETINLSNALAGSTFKLIFTWQNNNSSGSNPPASIDEVEVTYDLPPCSSSDEVNIALPSTNSFAVNNDYICPGETGTLLATGCTGGDLLWSNGSTQASITVSPTETTQYSVTCTPGGSSNIFQNAGFESSTNLQYWDNWDNASITTSGAHVYQGSKAALVNTIGQDWGGVAQGFSASPGTRYRVRLYAKTTNTNALPAVRYEFNNGGTVIENALGKMITSSGYQLYEFYMVSPPNTTWCTIYAEIGGGGQLYLDSWEVLSYSTCVSVATANVFVAETNTLVNHEFDNGNSNWDFSVQGGSSASLVIDNSSQLSGLNSALINISSASGTATHIQLSQLNKPLEAGKTYAFTFRAKAASNRNINISVDLGESPYTSYYSNNISLTTNSQAYLFTFLQPISVTNGRVGINFGESSHDVWIDNIEFFEVCESFEICDNGVDDDGDGLVDGLDFDCTTLCNSPDFNFSNPTLISGTARTVGSVYRFSNVVSGIDAQVTYVARSHSDIVLASMDEPEATNGGYEWAFQPIIDYNWLNPDGSMESQSSDKYITFKFDFFLAGTSTPYSIPTFNMSAIDVDGNGVDIREFMETNGFVSFHVQTPTTLTLSNAVRALGSLPAFDGVDETALTSMITFSYVSTNSITVRYGGKYVAGSNHNDFSENRLNCLFFKCYEYNTTVTCPQLVINGTPHVCQGNPASLSAQVLFHTTRMKPVVSYLCLNPGNVNGNNAVISQSNCNQSPHEFWRLEQVPGFSTRYFIRNLGSNLLIRPLNGGTSNNTNITQASGSDASFHWELIYHSIGRYHIRHVQSGKYMEVFGGNLSSGTPMVINSFNGNTNQQFYIDNGAIPYTIDNFDFNWSNGASSPTILDLPSASQTYTVSVTSNTNNCELVRSFPVEVTSAAASITGNNILCSGQSSTFNATGGQNYIWNTGATSSSISVSTQGNYTVTVTDDLGCTATATRSLTVYALPSAPVISTITQPTCTTPTGSVLLTGLPASGNWTITRTPGNVEYNGSGSSYTINNLPINTTYTFTVENANDCVSPASANVAILGIPSNPVLSGNNAVCENATATVLPSSGGTWTSSNTSVATINNAGVVTGIASGTVTLTYTRSSDGCFNTKPFTVNPAAIVPITSNIVQPNCVIPTGSVQLSSLPSSGNWTVTRSPGGTQYTGSGANYTVTGLPNNTTYSFTVANQFGCVSQASANVTVNGIPSSPTVNMDYLGSVCVFENKEITGVPSGGTPPFAYNWSGPSGFTATLDTIEIITSGNYYLTITDANFCTATTSGFVYQAYEPFIVTLNANICEGESVTLDVNSTTAISYLWSANAGNATTKLVTVTPAYPSSTYTVTVTNNLGCIAVPEMLITVYPKPIVSVSGPQEICVGQTSNLTPSSGGSWTSTNPSVASVTNGGLVTGLSAGTATFLFTESLHNCASNPSTPVIVKAKPVIQLTGPPTICVGDTSQMMPDTGGVWISNNPAVATINNSGLITGISAGTTSFVYTNNVTSCASNASSLVRVQSLPSVTMTGVDETCLGSNIIFSVNHSGGTWISSDTLIATVNSSGIISTLDTGSVMIFYEFTSGVCEGIVSKPLTIHQVAYTQYGGPDQICVGQTTFLTPSEGGSWISSNPSVATITNDGVVTALQSGYAAFTFVADSTGCISEPSGTLTVLASPSINLNGPSGICVGGTSGFLPFSGGTWTSLNPFVATITSNGTVTGVAAGQTRFIFTHAETGCISDTSVYIQVGLNPTATIDYHGSVCIKDDSQISVLPSGGNPPYTYQWVGPLGFTANLQTIDIQNNGAYYVTVTDNFGCKMNMSGYVYQRFDPIIVNLNTTICEGKSTNLSINASNPVSYLWSENAGSATTSAVTVFPELPSSTYNVTVTNNLGCSGVATAIINVNAKPVISITGTSNICVGQTTTMSPTTGGVWSSLNPSVASITNSGVITGTNAGTARFLFTQSSSGCVSDTSAAITINARTPISLGGPSSICVGNQTQLLPTSGGTWTALNPSIATIAPNGIVTGLAQGIAQFTFTNSQGCASSGSLSVTVNSKPAIVLNGPSQVCIGNTTQFLPSSGGTWVSSYPAVATITSTGLVNAISPGTAKFVFTNTSTGCISDSSALITILSRPVVSITGPTTICIGATTTLSPASGGTWTSVNPSIASVTNAGLVTGISAGNTAFVFTSSSTGCNSLPTTNITVNSRPSVSVTGPNGICIGSTTTLSPTSGGTWTSSNNSVATVTNGGLVTAVASGLANFSFTSASTGCISLPTGNVTVYSKPTVSTSATALCIGGTVNLQPSTGGTWTSLQPNIAIVNNSGIVTGLMSGTAQFVFTDGSTGCVSNPTASHTVSPKPTISITGASEFCQGTTTTLSPTTGGSWMSLSPSIASVTSAGIVTGLSSGTARFVFTTNLGCSSDPSEQVIINGKPLASINGPASICVGNTTTLAPAAGGTWVSSKTNIATVTPEGIVTGIAAGTARFVFTQASTGCSSDSSAYVTVNENPGVGRLGPATICIGQTSQLTPTAGGTWISLTTAVASINNAGLVTGIGAGTATFKFIQSSSGCETVYNSPVTVLDRPVTTLTGSSSICIGATTQFTPSSGGTWTSLNPSVASIDQTGIVTGLTQGITSFTFTSQSTGCISVPSTPITVLAKPSIALNGPSVLCIGSNTQFLPNGGGSWVSANPTIATITNAGIVTAVSQGNTNFIYTDNSTGCTSNPSVVVTVQPPADITVSGDKNICLGYNTTLSAATTGVWYSTRTDIAKTTSNGLVTGTAPGKVSFYFVDAFTGCATYLPNDILNVNNCTDPDFNVTMINVPLTGNIQTNDEVPMGTSYQNTVFLVSKPLGSTATITVNPDGTYTFNANIAGSYVYDIMVCLPSYGPNCPVSRLNIQVVNPTTESHNVLPNLDIMYTRENQSVTILSNENDRCISGLSCTVDPTKMTIVNQPKRGTAVLLSNGNMVYTPNNNTVGLDTIRYQICATNDATNCRSVSQIITVLATNADTTVAAADDFFFTPKGQLINAANVLANDRGTEGGLLTVSAQGSALTPVSIAAGTFYLTTAGELNFTPNANFTGPVDIPYTVCNTFGDCVMATAHILVLENLKVRIRAYLEGALMENGNQKASDNRPLMRDNLRMCPFTGSNYLPTVDPYSNPMTYFDLTSTYKHKGEGSLPAYTTISNPTAVFAVTGQNAIVDWVFVELRSKSDNTNILGTRSVLIQRDGDIVDLDGTSPVEFPGIRLDSVYVVVRHRNHFGVMSQLVYTGNLVDFTLPSTPVFDFGSSKNDGYDYTGLAQKPDIVLGFMSMWAGDFDSNGRIKFVNPDDDQNIMFFEVLVYPTNGDFLANYNFSYGYVQGDIDMNGKVKYDNPNDDKNILFYQILFHPLNVNFISNFNFISQQVPAGN